MVPRIAAAVDEPDDDQNKLLQHLNGCVANYVHAAGNIGVLLELNCKSEFLARSAEFSRLMKEVAMHIAALNPIYISRRDVPREISAKQEETIRQETAVSAEVFKRMEEFYQEVCLLEQPFVTEPGITVGHFIATISDEWGDKVAVRRFVRFAVGEGETAVRSKPKT